MADIQSQFSAGAPPRGWAKTSLGMIVSSVSAKANPAEDSNAHYVGLEHIVSGESQLRGIGKASDVKSTKNKFLSGDVLYGKLRPYLNKVAAPDFSGICSTDILVLRPENGIENGFVEAVLRNARFIDFATKSSSGINLPRTSLAKIAPYEFWIAPTKEQKRIVRQLCRLLIREGKLRKQLEELLELIQQYKITVLEAACSGRLVPTEIEDDSDNPRNVEPASVLLERILIERRKKWEADQVAKLRATGKELRNTKWKKGYREPQPPLTLPDRPIPNSSTWVSLDQLLYGIEAGKSFRCLPRPAAINEWGVIKVSAMSWGKFDESENKALPIGKKFNPHFEIREGDILLSRSNTSELVGASVLVAKTRPKLLLSDKSMRLLPSCLIDKEWLQLTISSKKVRNRLSEIATGASGSMLNVSQQKVSQVCFALPPLIEQRRIVNEAKRRLATANDIERIVIDASQKCVQMRELLFHKAISGALVPQSASDEPAQVLLKRIKEAKEGRPTDRKKSKHQRDMKKFEPDEAAPLADELWTVIAKQFDGIPFTFSQLMSHLPADYESMKVEIFNLLAAKKGRRLKQMFNTSEAQMKLQQVVP